MKYGMLSAVATAVMAASMPLSAATLNWTSAGDILTFDVHAQNENLNNAACAEVYGGTCACDVLEACSRRFSF